MHRLLSTIVVLAWGLWFGAIVMVFVTVTSLFSTFADQRQIAGMAAAGVFRRFELFELILAPLGFFAALLLRGRSGRWSTTLVAVLLALAAVGASASHFYLTPRIDELRRQGVASSSDEFKKLHGQSSMVYASQAVVLLAAGLLLPGAIARRRETAATTAPA
jgi:glucan phosphoethanolaminetransferase (alkaline phosphatase superfamily)